MYAAGQVFSLRDFNVTLPNIPTLLDEIECRSSGNEITLSWCSHKGVAKQKTCYHHKDIVIECTGTMLNLHIRHKN